MTVICKESYKSNDPDFSISKSITVGKSYRLIYSYWQYKSWDPEGTLVYRIMDDDPNCPVTGRRYSAHLFKTLDEVRDEKLNQLLYE